MSSASPRIGFILFGLNYSLLLAVLVGFSVLIPYIGAFVVTIPVVGVALFQFGAGTEFWSLFAVYLIIQGLDGNLLVPVLFSEAVNLHPLVIILSVVIFGGLWGFWGVFFAIPLATLIKAVVHARRMVWRSTTKAMRIKDAGRGLPLPASCFASGVFFQPVQHHVVVIAGFKIIKDVFDFAIGINEETNPVDPS